MDVALGRYRMREFRPEAKPMQNRPTCEEYILGRRRERKAWNSAWAFGMAGTAVLALIMGFLPELERHTFWFLLLGIPLGLSTAAGLWAGLREPGVEVPARAVLIALVTVLSVCCVLRITVGWFLGPSTPAPAQDTPVATVPDSGAVTEAGPTTAFAGISPDSIAIPQSFLNAGTPYSDDLRKNLSARREATQRRLLDGGGSEITFLQFFSAAISFLAQWAVAVCCAMGMMMILLHRKASQNGESPK